MSPLRSMLRSGLVLCLLSLPSGLTLANWVASGTFQYQDRPFTPAGFGSIVPAPIRFADVDVVDSTLAANKQVIARGKTDANGFFSISVVDSSVRTVRVRALTSTVQTPNLLVKVVYTPTGKVWSLSSPDLPGHSPGTSVDFGTLTAPGLGTGVGEAFNILDMGILGADRVKALTGAWPNRLVTFQFDLSDTGTSNTSGNIIHLRGTSGYDDPVILHEHGHYVGNNYWGSDNPGGSHALADCNQDLRLAFDEGRASLWGCSVRRANGFPYSQLYFRSNTVSFDNSFDLEDAIQYPCAWDTSEVAVARVVWDISDSATTNDSTPGTEDAAGFDTLALADLEWWQVFTGPARTATTISLEDFWDGWFDPSLAFGHKAEMTSLFNHSDPVNGAVQQIEFFPDAQEPNQTSAQAQPMTSNAPALHLTFFYDPDGNGEGAADTDWFSFNAVSGTTYTIQTANLLNAADTQISLIDTNGRKILASNDNRTPTDHSSLIVWQAPRSDLFYIKVTNVNTTGIYGSYDLSLTNP